MIHFSTEIEIANIVIRDPVTAVTNIAMFATALWCRKNMNGDFAKASGIYYWRSFFLFVGIASLIGVVVHGFSRYTSETEHFNIWLMMSWTQMIGIAFAQYAAIERFYPSLRKVLRFFVVVQLLSFASLMLIKQSYEIAKVHVAIGMAPVLVTGVLYGIRGHRDALILGYGILISCLPAIVHSQKISLSRWFNYNDIAHLIIIISFIVMQRGILLFEENAIEET